MSHTLFIVQHRRLGKSQVAAENPNAGFSFLVPKSPLPRPHTPSSWGTDFPSHVLLRSSHFAPWSSPGEVRSHPQTLQLPPPLRAAPGLARNSIFHLPQTELALGPQTAPQAVFPPPSMRRRDNSPNPRELAELCRGSVVSHPHPPLAFWVGNFGFPVSGRAFPAAACPWHVGKCGCLSFYLRIYLPPAPVQWPGVTPGEAEPRVKHSSSGPRRAGSGVNFGRKWLNRLSKEMSYRQHSSS